MPSIAEFQIATYVGDDEIGVINTIVDKNVIVVQYVTNANNKNGGYQAGDEVINSHCRVSTDFGASWKEITLDCTGETFLKYNINPAAGSGGEMMGSDGAMISFIIRHSTGGKFYMYTPILKQFKVVDDDMFNTRPLQVVGWLVHDQSGARVDGGIQFPVPEVYPADNIVDLGTMAAGIAPFLNLSTAAIAPNAPNSLAKPFITFHYEPVFGGMVSENYTGMGIANRTSTVDYTHAGKRYTIVQLYKTVAIKKGNIYSSLAANTATVPVIGFDYYLFTLPFLYVFDHENFKNADKSLQWVDVLNLNGRLTSLANSARGNKRARRFVRSLISDDIDFVDYPSLDTHHYESYDVMYPVDTGVTFTNTPRGELMKVHDAADKKDLLGFVYGDRRFVCTGDPTVATNWVAGEVTGLNKYPRDTYAFAFDRINPNGSLILTQFDANAKYSLAHDLWYREYKVSMTKSAALRLSVAADRVVAVPDGSRTVSNDLVYRFLAFAKDPATGRYTIDLLPGGIDAGVEALTNTQYQGTAHYPVEVNIAAGILYNTSDFIIERPISQYNDPLDTVPETAVEASIYVEGKGFDVDDYNVFATYCYYLNEYTVYEHKTNGSRVERMTDENATNCGWGDVTQTPKGATMLVYPDLELQINGSVPAVRCVQVEMVFSGDSRLILRPKAADFDSSFPGVIQGSVTVKADQPQTYGLTTGTATIVLDLNDEMTLAVAEYSGNQYYASSLRTAYNGLRITNPFGGPNTFRLEGGTGENLTMTAEGNGSIGTKVIIHRQGGQPSVTVNVSGRSAPMTRSVLSTATLIEYSN